MQANQRTTVVGVFEDRRRADEAVSALRSAGFRDEQIGVVMPHDKSWGESLATETTEDDTHAGTGALTGALAGLGLGALAGLGVLAGVIPVVGPAIAAGTLGVILSNAAAGAGIAGLVGALVGAGVPEHEAEYYEGEFKSGRTIVTVTADGRASEATSILRKYGAYDMSTRGATTGSTAACATGATSTAQTAGMAGRTAREGDTIQVKEERLHVEKRPVEAGEVHVRKEVHTEHKTIEVPVQREEVVIERRPAHGQAASGTIGEGGEIHVPVREEQVDVSKEAVVTEEVKVGKRVVQDTKTVAGEVRKEEVKIERQGDTNVRDRGTDRGTR
jgi:uncharacterized protein (TIGR02271 family)